MNDEELLARRLTWDEARGLAGESFEVAGAADAPAIAMQVASVNERASAPAMVQFALVFRGPHAPLLAQDIYRFRHARLGDFAFFITPIAQGADATDYEACFSHAP